MTKTSTSSEPLPSLEVAVGYRFNNPTLADRALTHRSFAHELAEADSLDARRMHGEALEFVGDSVLGCVIAERLFQLFPDANEGELSRMKHRLVSAASLALAAERIRLGEYLKVGKGEEKTGGRRKHAMLADAFEAVIAAVFLDGGYSAAHDFVLRSLGVELSTISPALAAAGDFKTLLQEELQARQLGQPRYRLIETEGPPHRRTFLIEVSWEGGVVQANGSSKKVAEIEAARQALDEIRGGETNPAS